MADRDHERDDTGWQRVNDAMRREIDLQLDEALAKYAAIEPRDGLEERVLANLRTERVRVPERAWWRWSVIPAVAAVVVVALALAWRSGRPSHPVAANHSPAPTQAPKEPSTQVVSNGESNPVRPSVPSAPRRVAGHWTNRAFIASAHPKLDQFPSPRPLSEQEKMLQNYVEEYPERAVLIARARTEELRRDEIERMKALASGDRATDPEPNSDTTER